MVRSAAPQQGPGRASNNLPGTLAHARRRNQDPDDDRQHFPAKKGRLQKSHIELHKHFATVDVWDEQAIARRGELLAERAVSGWPDFARRDSGSDGDVAVEEEVQEDVKLLITKVIDSEARRLGAFAFDLAVTGA